MAHAKFDEGIRKSFSLRERRTEGRDKFAYVLTDQLNTNTTNSTMVVVDACPYFLYNNMYNCTDRNSITQSGRSNTNVVV